MPVHDWTRVDAGLFHDFHQTWSVEIKNALNAGLLPDDYYALVEQRVGGPEPDVIAVETGRKGKTKAGRSGTATLAELPRTRIKKVLVPESVKYSRKANRITVRHTLGDVVAVIEIVSPGNKSSSVAVDEFVEKAVAFLRAGIHLLVIDLFPPTRRDLQGLNNEIAEKYGGEAFELPPGQPLSLAGYDAGWAKTAYIETIAVGDALPAMPLFLESGRHIPAPLESTYAATWNATPEPIRERLAAIPTRRRK
jgi:hypothetical protein